MNKFEKQKIAIEHTLKGMAMVSPKYTAVLSAFEIAKSYHTGIRKDKKTPEFQHQLDIVGLILTYSNLLIDPVETLVSALLHDTVEDYSRGSKVWNKEEERDRLTNMIPYELIDVETKFGKEIATTVNSLSKVINNNKKPLDQYFGCLALNRSALIIKAEDRYNNLISMFDAFSVEKQRSYAKEVFDYFIPALKQGEKNFPEQGNVYQMLKIRLKDKANGVLKMCDALESLSLKMENSIPENIDIFKNESRK